MERAATIPIMADLITQKVALWQGFWVLLFVTTDFFTLVSMLGLLLSFTLKTCYAVNVHGAETGALCACVLWFASRQASLARALWKRGIFKHGSRTAGM